MQDALISVIKFANVAADETKGKWRVGGSSIILERLNFMPIII